MTPETDVVERADVSGPAKPAAQESPIERDAQHSVPSGGARRWVAPGAMAAGIVLGVLLADSFGIGSDIRAGSGTLFAQGHLAQQLSGELSGNGAVGPSFWSKEGAFCRMFEARSGKISGLSGIACREKGGWRIRIVTETNGAAELPGSVKATMANLIVGVPLDSDAEQQARRQGWRPR
jgi:hypothetical protein